MVIWMEGQDGGLCTWQEGNMTKDIWQCVNPQNIFPSLRYSVTVIVKIFLYFRLFHKRQFLNVRRCTFLITSCYPSHSLHGAKFFCEWTMMITPTSAQYLLNTMYSYNLPTCFALNRPSWGQYFKKYRDYSLSYITFKMLVVCGCT